MHVVIDVRTATPHFPGIGRYASALADALPSVTRDDEAVTMLCVRDDQCSRGHAAIGVRSTPFSLRQQFEIPRVLTSLPADVYHSTYYLMPYRRVAPTILTVYDLTPLMHPACVSRRARRTFPFLLRRAIGAADHLLAISESTRSDLWHRLHVPRDRVTVTPLAASASFRPRPPSVVEPLRRRLELPERYVLYAGTNKPHKNLASLVEAWSLVTGSPVGRTWKLVIAGPWDPRYPEARRRSSELRLRDEILFTGPVAGDDLPALYSGAGLFVFPSLYEGFGLPVLEAMACGVPVACSATSSLPEVAADAGRYFEPMDIEGLAAILLELIADEAQRAVMSTRSILQARRFSWNETARSTMAVYREIHARSKRRDGP